MFDILPNFLTTLTILLPIYASHKALSAVSSSTTPLHQQPALLTPWLTYFLILTLFHLAESYAFPLTYLPLYAYARLFAHVYLLLPGQTRGATYIYKTHVAPFLSRHETRIESFIAGAHTQLRAMGLGQAEAAVEWARVNAFGMERRSERNWAAEAAQGPPSSNNYVASLLGRFSVPFASDASTATTNAPTIAGPGGASAVAGFLGTALAQASSLAAAPNGSVAAARARGGVEGGMNEALIPPHLKDDRERLAYIASRREQLRTLLGAFEREEQEITLAGIGASGNGQSMGRSKSEAEFENIASADAPSQSNASPKGSGGWSSWLGRSGSGGGGAAAGKGGKEN